MPSDAMTAEAAATAISDADKAKHLADQMNKAREDNASAPLNVPVTFRFKAVKDKDTGKTIPARPALELVVPHVTASGLLDAMEDAKVTSFILELVNESVINQARAQINDDETGVSINPKWGQDDLDLNKLTLFYLANEAPATRRGGGISSETWTAFGEDYVMVMTAKTEFPQKVNQKAAQLLVRKFIDCKTNKKVIAKLLTRLATWSELTENAEDFVACTEYLSKRADILLNADEEATMLNNI